MDTEVSVVLIQPGHNQTNPTALQGQKTVSAPPPERTMSPDMAKMMDDILLHDPDAFKTSTPVETPAKPELKEPITDDMRTMVDDIRRAQEKMDGPEGTHLVQSQNGVLMADFDESDLTPEMREQVEHLKAQHEAEAAEHSEQAEHGQEAHKSHKKEKVGHVMTGTHLLIEGLEVAGMIGGIAVGGAIGAGVVGIGMTALGISHIQDGREQKEKDEVVEGTGAVVLGARSTLSAVSIAGHHASGALGVAAHAAHAVLAPLGVIHGVVDTVMGSKKVYEGVKEGDHKKTVTGAMGVGLGVSIAAASLGGGLPMVIAAAAFLTGKIIVHEKDNIAGWFKKSPPAEAQPDPHKNEAA